MFVTPGFSCGENPLGCAMVSFGDYGTFTRNPAIGTSGLKSIGTMARNALMMIMTMTIVMIISR